MLLKPNALQFKPLKEENKPAREYYGLLLQNQLSVSQGGFCLDTTSNANAIFQVNFDALFQGRGNLFNKCQVRGRLVSDGLGETPVQNALGFVSIIGLPSSSFGTNGTYILPLNPSPQTDAGDLEQTGYYFSNSSMSNRNGTQVSIPTGIRQIQVQFRSVAGSLHVAGNIPDYSLYLEFELYERK
jgi:hypothetical protein